MKTHPLVLKKWTYYFGSIVFLAFLISSNLFAQSLIVIRHGQATHNVKGIFSGKLKNANKYPLTQKGRQQVQDAAQKLSETYQVSDTSVAKVFYSPFLRTKETADILVQGLKIDQKKMVADELLIDIDMGTFEEVSEWRAALYLLGGGDEHSRAKSYGGETDDDVRARIKAFLHKYKLVELNGDVIVVTHGTPAVEIIALFNKDQKRGPELKNAEFKIIKLD